MRASASGAERKAEQLGSVLIGGRRCVSAEGRAAAWLRGGKANPGETRWEWKRRADKHLPYRPERWLNVKQVEIKEEEEEEGENKVPSAFWPCDSLHWLHSNTAAVCPSRRLPVIMRALLTVVRL